MRGICKSFGGAPALQDVDLDLDAGEVLALLGANGAGKSTLVRILCGVYGKDRGSIRLDGKESALSGPEEALGQGVRFLPQEVSVLPDLSVAENILIADLPLRRTLGIALVDRAAMRKKAGELLSRLGLALDPDRHVSLLSAPEQRLVEIARALAMIGLFLAPPNRAFAPHLHPRIADARDANDDPLMHGDLRNRSRAGNAFASVRCGCASSAEGASWH